MSKYFNKQTIGAFIIGVLIASSIPTYAAIQEYILKPSTTKLVIDNVEVKDDTLPMLYLEPGYNYIPAATQKKICDILGIEFEYDGTTNMIKIDTTKTSSALNLTTSTINESSLQTSENYITSEEEIGDGEYYKTPPTTILPSDMEWYLYEPTPDGIKYWCIKYQDNIYMEYTNALVINNLVDEYKFILSKTNEPFSTIKETFIVKNDKKVLLDETQIIEVKYKYINLAWINTNFN